MDQLSLLCEETIVKKFFYISKQLEHCSFDESNEFMLTKSPYHSPMFNICWFKKVDPIYFESCLRKIINYFYPKPFALWSGVHSSLKGMEHIINELDFIKVSNNFSITYPLQNINPEQSILKKNNIFELEGDEKIENYIQILEAIEPSSRGYYIKAARDLGFSNTKPYRYFYLESANKPVCVASLFFNANICGVFDIVTHSDYRNKGYALKMFAALSSYAKVQGSSHMCMLASSPISFDVNKVMDKYKKHGFTEYQNYDCYIYKTIGV